MKMSAQKKYYFYYSILGSLLLFVSVLINSCADDSSPAKHYEVLRKDLNWGEYLQTDGKLIYTVSRKAAPVGIVTYNPNDKAVTVLEPRYPQAKDLKLDHGQIVFRAENDVRFLQADSKLLVADVEKLRTFQYFPATSWGRITYDLKDKTSHWLTFKVSGEKIAEGLLPGSGRLSIQIPQDSGQEYLFFQTASGLTVGSFGHENEGILEQKEISKIQSSYMSARILKDQLYLAVFDDELGVLYSARRPASAAIQENFEFTSVDGVPDKTYIGQDPAILDDHRERPRFVYLDAWELKLRVATWDGKKYVSQQLPFEGAIGFYSVVFQELSKSVLIFFHNFRTQLPDNTSIFENLATSEIAN